MGFLVGVDEVGRGCLAGPLLVVAARPKAELPPGLKDSKLLSRKRREELYELLRDCCQFGEGWAKASEIDRHGLAGALRLGVRRALNDLDAEADEEILIDGSVNYAPKKYRRAGCMIDADALVPIVSAASIYAKVTRDRYMFELAKRHPNYHFADHVGYGTKAHMLALKKLGALKYIHRYSYMPITQLSGDFLSKPPSKALTPSAP